MAIRTSWVSSPWPVALAILLLGGWPVHAQSDPFGTAKELTAGTQPHCALGSGGTLHIVFKEGGGIRYMTLDAAGTASTPETIGGGDGGSNPWVCVATDGSVHVVWDTWSKAYYTNRSGGSWKTPILLPQERPERNYMVQVTGGYGSEVYTSHWSITKGGGGFSLFTKVTNVSGPTPTATKLLADSRGANRPPSVVGPTAAVTGDGKVHLFIGGMQTTHMTIDSSGAYGSETNISRTPSIKTVEGLQGYYVGTGDVGIVTHWWDGNETGVVVNSLSRAKASEQGLVAGISGQEFSYPRAAYDPVNMKVYILYPAGTKPAVSSWDPRGTTVTQLGNLTSGNLSTGTRGPGAGGIAPRDGGGAHAIYSTGGKIYHRTIEAGSSTVNQPPQAKIDASVTSGGVGDMLTFDGSGSNDLDGSIANYVWDFGDGSSTAAGATATHAWSSPGPYTVTLTVADNVGATATAELQITITIPDTTPPQITLLAVGIGGAVDDPTVTTVQVDSTGVTLTGGTFSSEVATGPGPTSVLVTATDAAGNAAARNLYVVQ